MQFEVKLTLDGLMTLIAGLIAFIAVMIQIRSSSGQLRDQLEAQRDAERQEQERQRRVVANAVLFEIDGLYRYLLRDVRNFLRDVNPETENLKGLEAKPGRTNPFVVFEGNVYRIGELEQTAAADVVRFYMGARAYFSALERYDTSRDRYLSNPSDHEVEDLTRQYLGMVKRAIPPLIVIAHRTCKELCGILDITFQGPDIAVAAEDMDALREEITKMGDGAIFEPGS
jgi:hypothetical protein